MVDYPILVFFATLIILWLACRTGLHLSARLDEDDHLDLGVILTAALTLLGLIVGFTFSMAVTRYDQRKNLEAEEANAIGTEMARVGLLPAPEAGEVRDLLRRYLSERMAFYATRDRHELQQIKATTARTQADLWSAVQTYATGQPSVLTALVVSGMNDILNSQGFIQAAFWNRIPGAAWVLMAVIAICCNALLGFTARHREEKAKRFTILPLIVATAFFLIADIDSPRGGVVRIHPENLEDVCRSWQCPGQD